MNEGDKNQKDDNVIGGEDDWDGQYHASGSKSCTES